MVGVRERVTDNRAMYIKTASLVSNILERPREVKNIYLNLGIH